MNYLETIKTLNPRALSLDGFDDCIIGIGQGGDKPAILAYSQDMVLKKLQEKFGMTEKEAIEFYAVSMLSYHSKNYDSPVFVGSAEYE